MYAVVQRSCSLTRNRTMDNLGKPISLHLCSSEAALLFRTDSQVQWWVNKFTETQIPCFWGDYGKKTWHFYGRQRGHYKHGEPRKKGGHPHLYHVQGSNEIIMCTVPKKNKKKQTNKTRLSYLTAIVPFSSDHSHLMLYVSIDHCRRAHGDGSHKGTNNKQMWSAKLEISLRLLAHKLFRMCWAESLMLL